MKNDPLKQLGTLGHPRRLDYIRRDLIAKGDRRRLIDDNGLRDVISNPSIFHRLMDKLMETLAQKSPRYLTRAS